MSVEQYGARLLGEIEEESLDELLRDLRKTIDPTPKDVLGLPQFDRLLEIFRFGPEQPPSHQRRWPSTEYIGPGVGEQETDDLDDDEIADTDPTTGTLKHHPPIVEVTSTRSASGKTTLLYYLTAIALLPIDHGGKASSVVWVDTDNSFSGSRLAQISNSILSKHRSKPSSTDSIVTNSLQHLFILQPTSSTSLLSKLEALPTHLLNQPSRFLPTRPLALLLLDSATSFSFQDRFDAEISRLSAQTTTASDTNIPSRSSQIINALREIQETFQCTILFTTTTTKSTLLRRQPVPQNPNIPSPPAPTEPPRLSPYTSFATLTLQISRIPVPQFAPNMTLDECLHDRSKRQETVAKGRFVVTLNWEGSEMWPAGVRDVINSMDAGGAGGRGGFVLRVDGEGVEVE